MRNVYDFSNSVKNPYAKRLKKTITLRIDEETIAYFKAIAENKGVSYQSLMDWYLKECATTHRELEIK